MTDQEMLKAMAEMLAAQRQELKEEMVCALKPIKQEIQDVKKLTTKTAIILENDINKKIDLLYEGYELHNEKIDLLISKVDELEASTLANEVITKKNLKEITELKLKAQ